MQGEKKSPKKEKAPTVLRVVFPLIFILLLAALGFALYPMFAPSSGPDIVQNVITLRGEQDTLQRSRLVTLTDQMVKDTGERQLEGEWDKLTQCMPEGCDDAEYFNFLVLVTQRTDVPNSELIQNLIATYKYWGSEQDLVRFSKAMTSAEKGIENSYSRALDAKWKEIVECDGNCPEENDLFFDAIDIAVQLE